MNADVAWSPRRVNERTSEKSADVGCAHPQALCDSVHPCHVCCPSVMLCSSRCRMSSMRCSTTENLWEDCVPEGLSELSKQREETKL
jgi:hypothetical protein